MMESKSYLWIRGLLFTFIVVSLAFLSFKYIQKYISGTKSVYTGSASTSVESGQIHYGKLSEEGEISYISNQNEYGIVFQIRIQTKDVFAYDFLFTKEMLDHLKVINKQGIELNYTDLRVGQKISLEKNVNETSPYVQYIFQIIEDPN